MVKRAALAVRLVALQVLLLALAHLGKVTLAVLDILTFRPMD
jgi:hypothetical protein